MSDVTKAVQQAVAAKGCAHLAHEIVVYDDEILRPDRALNMQEALAMACAWRDGYKAMGVATCQHSYPLTATTCDCPLGATPDMDDEGVASAWIDDFTRPAR